MLLFLAWLLTGLWQFIGAPFLLVRLKDRFADGGWAFGRLVGWLCISLIIWFVAHTGFAVNQSAFIWIVTLGLGVVAHRHWRMHQAYIRKFWQTKRSLIIATELCFLFGFLVLPLIRGFHPQIFDLEKFMDAGLMISYTKSPTLPLMDMWLAGEKFNYYTFGHFMGAVASQFWNIPVPVSYNILLGLVCGLVLCQTFGLVGTFVAATFQKSTQRAVIAAGIVGVLMVAIGGNGHAAWYLAKNHSFEGYWYPDATRFIDRTIHEYPSYSFIVSDLHAHVWSLPIVLLTLAAIAYWLVSIYFYGQKGFARSEWWQSALVVGVLLGVLMMTSSWDTAIYSLLLGVVGILLLASQPKSFGRLVISAILIVLLLIVTSSMWWLNFESISEGVWIAKEQSPLWQLAVLWGPHVLTSAVALGFAFWAWRQAKQESPWLLLIMAVVTTAVILLILPELIFVKDIYPNHPRANTMFKLTFQAFVMMGLVVGWLAGWSQGALQKLPKFAFAVKGWLLVLLMAVLLYPYFGYRDYYDRLKTYHGLDGLQWLQEQHPDDYAAIVWLNQTVVGRPHIVEAVGESYTTFARVATFTGLPTVLGWRVHEWLWRGGFEIPGQRTEEVRKVYEEPLTAETARILNQYQVRYIFIGDKEREAYKAMDEVGLKSLGATVFQSGKTTIIERVRIN